MNALEFLRNPAKPGLKAVYAVFGEDAYLRQKTVSAIVRLAFDAGDDDPGLVRFAGEKTPLADVLDELRTLPFLSSRRLALVEDADTFVTKHRKELEDYADRPSATGTLVLTVKNWPGNTKLAKKVEQIGLSVDCKAPAEKDLAPWLIGLARADGARLEDDAARLMVELVGNEVGLLASEVEKLVTYVGDRKVIARADVARMVDAGRVEKIWKLIEAATTGKAAEALDDLDSVVETKDGHPIKILAGMWSMLRLVHHAGALRRARRDLRDACEGAGINKWAVEKTGKQHAHLGPSRTSRLPAIFLQADLDLKGASPLPPRTVLEKLIVELAKPRRD